MKVYTKTGDKGMTSLIGGERVFKTDERVEAYGSVDELSAFAALLTDRIRGDAALAAYVEDLNRILSRLMSVEALLATGEAGSDKVSPLAPEAVSWLESRIDTMQAALKPIDKFTVPGGDTAVSLCHVCRTVCRRAERAALRADAKYGVDSTALVWLNRLSDYFYLLGRTLTAYSMCGRPCGFPDANSVSAAACSVVRAGFSRAPGFPVHGNRALRSLVPPVSTEAARNRTASIRWNNP